ncbi:MAG: MoxR family ATPase [Acidobacteriota bacterium]
MSPGPHDSREGLSIATARIAESVRATVVGQEAAAEMLLATYVAGGHALIEGVPGIAKTLLARAFSSCLGLRFARVQFTPDLMPSDLIGGNVYDQSSGGFRLVRGPVFTEVLMADEINRTPPKTQSALLEAMQETQVTIDGTCYPLDGSFFVIATQNPIEFEGTYPLPEAQLDRFIARVKMGLPAREAELEIYRRAVAGTLPGWGGGTALPPPAVSREQAIALRRGSASVHVAPELLEYLASLAAAVRGSARVEIGISPRGALALLETARALALIRGRDFLSPDDLKACLAPCWGHRVLLTAEAELEGDTPSKLLGEIAGAVAVPR